MLFSLYIVYMKNKKDYNYCLKTLHWLHHTCMWSHCCLQQIQLYLTMPCCHQMSHCALLCTLFELMLMPSNYDLLTKILYRQSLSTICITCIYNVMIYCPIIVNKYFRICNIDQEVEINVLNQSFSTSEKRGCCLGYNNIIKKDFKRKRLNGFPKEAIKQQTSLCRT